MRARVVLAAALAVVATACSAADEQASLSWGPVATTTAGGRGPVAAPPGAPASAAAASLAADPPVEAPPLPLNGCPPPPRPPGSATDPGPAYVPPLLVPESALPVALPAGQWTSDLTPFEGKGMWVWKYYQSEDGDASRIVERAAAAGLRQLWVRVGDSKDGFYARDVLDALVPKAHTRGIAVVGWGFPFLFDPVGDARWTGEALAWRGPAGEWLDGFSPDIELSSEGVAVSETRVRVYLGLVRRAAAARPVVATVYRPSDRLWPDVYPYTAIAPYVDAFAAMVYWNCLEPGAVASQAIERLRTLRPVHVVGQAYDASADGGRGAPPDALETRRFLDVSRRGGAIGASFWVWQHIGDEQWSAMSAFPWPTGR